MSNEDPSMEGDAEESSTDGAPAADPESVEAEIERAAADLEGVTDPFADEAEEVDEEDSVEDASAREQGPAIEEGATPGDGETTEEPPISDDDAESTDLDDGSADGDEEETITLGGDEKDRAEEGGGGDDLVTVEAHISPVQREVWQRQADQAKLTMSEYIRRMVEAGRMSVQMELAEQMEAEQDQRAHTDATDEDELRDQILFLLEREEVLSWEELVEKLSRNFEEAVGQVLEALQDEDRVRHSGFRGGYVLLDGEED